MPKFVLTVTCPTRRGIVAAISTFLADHGCNITDSAQFDDQETGRFFMRVGFQSETGATLDGLTADFAAVGETLEADWQIFDSASKIKVLLMVSNFGHCLNDLLYRWRIGALPIEIVGVVSNHLTYQKVVVNHDIPFHLIKVTKDNKPEAEARLMALVDETGAELVVLARYMQVLSDAFCARMSGRIINIHHSFLPSFKGANPYKQAYQRGVKLIGATAHYVTADLDEGPIIEQDTVRITHAQSPDDYVRPRPRRRGLGPLPRDPRPYPPPGLPQRQQDRGLPGVPRRPRLRTDGLSPAFILAEISRGCGGSAPAPSRDAQVRSSGFSGRSSCKGTVWRSIIRRTRGLPGPACSASSRSVTSASAFVRRSWWRRYSAQVATW